MSQIAKKEIRTDDIDNENFDLELERNWIFWAHHPCVSSDYSSSRQKLHNDPINSIKKFWSYLNDIPPVNTLLTYPTKNFKSIYVTPSNPKIIEGWSLFLNHISPDWEDEKNKQGVTITFRIVFKDLKDESIQEIWLNTLLEIIGENMPFSDHVNGCRVLGRGPNFRIEIWLNVCDDAITNSIQEYFKDRILPEKKKANSKDFFTFTSPHTSSPESNNSTSDSKQTGKEKATNTEVTFFKKRKAYSSRPKKKQQKKHFEKE